MKIKKILCLILCMALCVGMASTFAGCKNQEGTASTPDAFVIMTEQLDGLFNPFYYTAANDGNIVAMTQISMLGASYQNEQPVVAYGENEAVVTKDMEVVENKDASGNVESTTYTFVLKNGIKFSDGHPLTMEDVLFSYYVYLDPVYTGSNTLYSTKILGLDAYRTQTVSSGSVDTSSQIESEAATRASNRMMELIQIYSSLKKSSSTGEVSISEMNNAITAASLSSGYKSAVSADPAAVTNADLQADYDRALELFKEELQNDYVSAQESFTEEPYKSHGEFADEVFCFMFYEGYVAVEYEEDSEGKIDRTKIKTLTKKYPDSITTKEQAIDYVYNDMTATSLDVILLYSVTGNTMSTEFSAKAKEVILRENAGSSDSLTVPNISGIVSLGHTDQAGSTVTVNGNSYTVASGHNADGTVTDASQYDVLQITIEGVDPKAVWNFGITVAPQHYYGAGASTPVDIANNQFGVDYASFDFMTDIIQSPKNIKLPMGAGSYMATDASSSDTPSETGFYTDNVVYFKANPYFETVGEGLSNAKINLVRYKVVSSSNAVEALKSGDVHYVSPSMTQENYQALAEMESSGVNTLYAKQLGYGYIGVNASKVTDINLRKAIMSAMNTALALDYYRANTAQQIWWPQSTVSWAYPTGADATDNGRGYPQIGTWNEQTAIQNVQNYMTLAGVSAGDSSLKLTFTIAGSSLTDHPCYKVFRDAADLLNSLGWDVEVVCDTQALTKINTGSLTVWAAAWSSALDPDMYQVYHKDSKATSTLAWGYKHLLSSGTAEELQILNNLSATIDDARAILDQAERTALYKEAMGYVLDLAVELPVYQRSVLYGYNANVINADTVPTKEEINPYSSPLDRIWEIEFVSA